MIEKIILDYLNTELTVPCYMEIPDNETEFVIIQKTGSGEKNLLSSATIAFQSYSDSLYGAALLNEKVKSALKVIPAYVTNITRSQLNSDYPFNDTNSKRYRYQAVFDFNYYEGEN